MLATLENLGVVASFSRPRVSNDNPYAELLFRTCKYRPDYSRNRAVTQMDEVTQQNTALVEEAAAAVASMDEQAGKMRDVVAVFRTAATWHSDSARRAVRLPPNAIPASRCLTGRGRRWGLG
ncbi:hypothetical protein FSO04_41625 [Paraburkholderia madseniana]|uniref:Transposase n=1 Tax=Paraburkholderia madseniana TaxID=2599607 RepID=A0A6N6W092_9BURK|nr:hypothetical protein FSO04_41625 [Paraburkholderia madseniana]